MEPSEFCYSPNYVVFKREYTGTYGLPGYMYKNYRYNFVTHTVDFFMTYHETTTEGWEVPYGTNVDFFQIDSNKTFRIYTNGNTVNGFIINNAKLLTVTTNGVDQIGVNYFNTSTKTVSTILYSTLIPCHPVFSLAEDIVLAAICDGYTRNEYYHNGDGGVNIVSTPNSSVCGYIVPVENTILTESKLVRVEHCIPVNPIMLTWKNSLGGWDYWLFGKRQTINIETESKGFVGVPIWDIETAEETVKEIGKNLNSSIVLGASNLSVQEKNGIEQVLSSNIVYQLFKDGSKRRVSVSKGSYVSLETDSSLQNIEFEIRLPSSYTLSN